MHNKAQAKKPAKNSTYYADKENAASNLAWERPAGQAGDVGQTINDAVPDMSKLEAVGSAQEQIAELQNRLADLEEENRRLKMSPDIVAASVGFAERSSILFRSGVYEWDEVADQCTACSAGLAALFERPSDRVKERLSFQKVCEGDLIARKPAL